MLALVVGLSAALAAARQPPAGGQPASGAPKGIENLRQERTQLFHTVRAGHRYHDGNAARSQVLLKREVPIDREERLGSTSAAALHDRSKRGP